jgi:hypothetical protein
MGLIGFPEDITRDEIDLSQEDPRSQKRDLGHPVVVALGIVEPGETTPVARAIVSSFSAQELRQGLGVFGLAPLGTLGVFDHSLRPWLAYPLPGVGLDRFDE